MRENPILLDIPDHFETARLLIRVPRLGEGEVTNAAVRESIDKLRLWLKWAQRVPTLAESEARNRRELAAFLTREYLHFKIWRKEDGQFVGGIGLNPDWSIPSFEMGYWVRTRLQGHGYITEAVKGLADYAFEHLEAQRLEIICDPLNHRSAAVAERADFRLEARLANSWRTPQGELTDSLIYSKITKTV
jgi:ribosomal-protein-serine acetyltransferase